MTPSARAAALRSTALATSLALAVGLSALVPQAWAKVPLPKPRPIARNVGAEERRRQVRARGRAKACHTTPMRNRCLWPRAPSARFGAGHAPACRAAAAGAQQVDRSGRGRRDVIDLAGRQGCAGERRSSSCASGSRTTRRRLEATISDPVARKLAEWLILRSDNNGASVERYRAFLAANPSWPSQTFLRRRIEAALWDDQREDSAVWSWFENESPISAKGRLCARKSDDRPRRPRQCRAPGARSLAQRSDVARTPRPAALDHVRRAAHRW